MPAMFEVAQVGKRQEIKDKIFNVEAAETPMVSWMPTDPTPNQLLMTYVAERYPDVASTGILDGAAATTPAKVDRILVEACGQHFRREWGVTTLAQLTNAVGVARNEAGHQMMLAMLLLKRMIEQQLCSADDLAMEGDPTPGGPWTMRGILSWLSATAQAYKPVNALIRPPTASVYTGAVASFDEAAFRTVLQSAFNATKAKLSLDGFVGSDLQVVLDDFTNIYPTGTGTKQTRTVYQIRDNSTYRNAVDTLKFSFGEVRVQLTSFLGVTTSTGAASAYTPKSGVFLNRRMWALAYMQKPANTNLAPDGSGKKGFVDAVLGLKCFNPRGECAVIANS